MRNKIKEVLERNYSPQGFDLHKATNEILSLLDENGVGVSDSSDKHGDLPHVRKRNIQKKQEWIDEQDKKLKEYKDFFDKLGRFLPNRNPVFR